MSEPNATQTAAWLICILKPSVSVSLASLAAKTKKQSKYHPLHHLFALRALHLSARQAAKELLVQNRTHNGAALEVRDGLHFY